MVRHLALPFGSFQRLPGEDDDEGHEQRVRGQLTRGMRRDSRNSFEDADVGRCYRIPACSPEEMHSQLPRHPHKNSISELAATSICGNDITSSCFYVMGEIVTSSGIYAPICTVLSSITLFCFRSIYAEVVMALPLNGGIYNLLLNSSTKQIASMTACLTILSYTATGVVSAVSAANYLQGSPVFESIQIVPCAIFILAFFAVLMLMGMAESSTVATGLFLFHLSVLSMLAGFCVIYLQEVGFHQFRENLNWAPQPDLTPSIFYGFSSAMLGVSGFETSANFVEEQKVGVFQRTLFNMWAAVSSINFTFACLCVAILPLDEIVAQHSPLAFLAERVAGSLMRDVVTIDALLVLAGAVLTSYVGVCGLLQRMSGDRCLPALFANTNELRGTPHNTIILFFAVCTSMCMCLQGHISMLAAIYSISFLLVMGLFAICGLFMKVKRPTLPRKIITPRYMFVAGLLLVGCAFIGVVLHHRDMLTYFFLYYGLTVCVVMITFARAGVFTSLMKFISTTPQAQMLLQLFVSNDEVEAWIKASLKLLWNQRVLYFTKRANLSQINRAVQYIEENEEARIVGVVRVHGDGADDELNEFLDCVQLIDRVYPQIRVDCVLAKGEFSPSMIPYLAEQMQVPVNCMFINCPKHDFRIPIDELGGVRIIMNSERSRILDSMKNTHESSFLWEDVGEDFDDISDVELISRQKPRPSLRSTSSQEKV